MRARTIVLAVTAVVVALATLTLTDDPTWLLVGGTTATAALVLAYATTEGEPWWTSDPAVWDERPDGWDTDRRPR